MFVVSKKRIAVLTGLAYAWALLCGYSFFGLVFWAGLGWLGIMKLFFGGWFIGMFLSVNSAVDALWPPHVFLGSVVVTFAFWFVSVRSLQSYRDRKKALAKINKVIQEIPSLSERNGSISYTAKRSYGSASTEIVAKGEGSFEIRTTFRNQAGAYVNDVTSFKVTEMTFTQDGVCSELAFNRVLGVLLVQKEYGVQHQQIDEVMK